MTWVPPGPGWLFCPADRPERYEKAAQRADVVILDLEDAVAAGDKPKARQSLLSTPLDPAFTVVRVNAHSTSDFDLDMAALARTSYRRVMLPKCESSAQIEAAAPYEVIALVESPLGAVAVFDSLGAANSIGVMWGAEDLIAALGGKSSRFPDGTYRGVAQHVRSTTLLAAKARGVFALDSVVLDIGDIATLTAESEDAMAVGFDGKVAIHPSQVPIIREAFAPTQAEIDWADRVVAAAADERGVFRFEGQMVDAPVLRQAEQILRTGRLVR